MIFVGDVHGCSEELERLVQAAGDHEVVLVGDLFTKGPDPAGVWRLVREGGWRAVLGNHDERLIQALDGERPGDTHAAEVIAALDAEDREWRDWVRSLPLFIEEAGYTVVHAGIHPSGSLQRTSRQMALTLRRWPDCQRLDNPFWYQVYEGGRRVVFGHDAARGLVRVERQGEPWIIGLDSGCVYGKALTAYLPGEDRLVQVPAARTYVQPAQANGARPSTVSSSSSRTQP